jgi:hypothetical protein
MNEAHKIRDHIFDTPPANAVDTGETFDCVIVGGGLSGLAAALFFNSEAGSRLWAWDFPTAAEKPLHSKTPVAPIPTEAVRCTLSVSSGPIGI